MSLKDRIRMYSKGRPYQWISGAEYERLAMQAGYKASNCSRRLRELNEGGILERRETRGHVEYRYIDKRTNREYATPIEQKVEVNKQGALQV